MTACVACRPPAAAPPRAEAYVETRPRRVQGSVSRCDRLSSQRRERVGARAERLPARRACVAPVHAAARARRRCRAARGTSPWAARRPCRRSCRAWRCRLRRRAGRRGSGRRGRARRRRCPGARAWLRRRPRAIAPMRTDARSNAPVFSACRRCSASSVDARLAGRVDVERLAAAHAAHAGGDGEFARASPRASRAGSGASASSSKASDCSASPARIAVASSNATCTVGLPRRSASSSIAGRSSCTSE